MAVDFPVVRRAGIGLPPIEPRGFARPPVVRIGTAGGEWWCRCCGVFAPVDINGFCLLPVCEPCVIEPL